MSSIDLFLPTVLVLFNGPSVAQAATPAAYYHKNSAYSVYEQLYLGNKESIMWYSYDTDTVYVRAGGGEAARWEKLLSENGFILITPAT